MTKRRRTHKVRWAKAHRPMELFSIQVIPSSQRPNFRGRSQRKISEASRFRDLFLFRSVSRRLGGEFGAKVGDR